MTEEDRPRFLAAFTRVCACQGRPVDQAQGNAYFESKLGQYPIATVLEAMDAAVLRAGRFIPEVGLIADVIDQSRGGGRGQSAASYAPGVYRNDDGVVVARWRCVFCEDTGWRAKLTATGEVLTQDELIRRGQDFGPPREDHRPHYFMTRCQCRMAGQQRGAA